MEILEGEKFYLRISLINDKNIWSIFSPEKIIIVITSSERKGSMFKDLYGDSRNKKILFVFVSHKRDKSV